MIWKKNMTCSIGGGGGGEVLCYKIKKLVNIWYFEPSVEFSLHFIIGVVPYSKSLFGIWKDTYKTNN